ncbi:MAG: type IV secretion protein IcmK [Gammaproteobacteria bacterium]|nr:type IV secretion protein IcmK [Gammaproteobacteria bacterium]MCW5582570.1 type IV secretion protein IcmK [Gammaproteobacteria bacterium]
MAKWVLKMAFLFLILMSVMPCAFAQQANAPTPQMTANQFQRWLQTNGYGKAEPVSPSANTAAAKKKFAPPVMTFEQSQQAMIDTAPPSRVPISQDAAEAFNTMLQQNMPLSPQQVVQLRQQVDIAQRAAAIPANVPPKPVSTTLMVNLAPGTTPPAVRLAQGYVSSLVFVDSTGSPWPIAAFDIGNPKAVNIQWDGKSNILLIQAVSAYSNGDIVVRLVGLPTPVTLELVSGQRVVDYRVDIHVSGIGPNAKDLPIGTTLPNSANQLLLGVLDGVAPAGSKLLNVIGADCQAWLLGEKMYLRTRLTVLSPGWVGKMVSPDGMQAYELPKTSSVLISRYGEPAEIKIEGF